MAIPQFSPPTSPPKARFIVVMGVSGCGKTSVGEMLAAELGWAFYDADRFHPPENIAKMAQGIPLDDNDRLPWLNTLHTLIASSVQQARPGVLACSALKEKYREILRGNLNGVSFVYLQGTYDLIWARMSARMGHYMKPAMLQSQFTALEEPADALTLDITPPVAELVQKILGTLPLPGQQLGLLGLGVMGRALALNFERHGYQVIGYDPNPKFEASLFAQKNIVVVTQLRELFTRLETPRRILLMVPAGHIVDQVLDSLQAFLSPGDTVIDGGNSHFADTDKRLKQLAAAGVNFVGLGVSGGEQGALWGPSLMPGGAAAAWATLQPMLRRIAAVAPDGTPCVTWIGAGGAGHYVKMVHNGLEYGDMQLIAETYDLLHRGAGLSNAALAEIFAQWQHTELASYLIEITAHILRRQEGDMALVDLILDEAAQKGTGQWSAQNALHLGAPIPTIMAAVESRTLSSLKTERRAAAQHLGQAQHFKGDPTQLITAAAQALYASKLALYAQGFALLRHAAAEYHWALDYTAIASVWRAGCIIRANMLEEIRAAFAAQPDLPNLLLAPTFTEAIRAREKAWRTTILTGVELGLPLPTLSASLTYFDAYRSERLPANLIQAQRDYFGAHTFKRIDQEGKFHADWHSTAPLQKL